jgi:aryl-alcohol dehydrogenase-like predicted oxidoreductase
MRYRVLGRSGLKVSVIGFGAWQLSNPLWGGPDEATSVRLVQAALDGGCSFFDTAPGYGEGASERLLGQALRGRRDAAVICTKFGHTLEGESDFAAASLRPALEASLRRLQTDRVDVLLLHNPPARLLDGAQAAELYAELTALRAEGKLRAFGASVDWADELRTLSRTTPSTAAEVLFNAFHQEPRAAFTPAADAGLGLIAKVPLDSGWLSGKYDEHSRFEGIRDRWTPEVVARRSKLVRELRAILPSGLTLTAAALRFVVAHESVATVIPGAKNLEQLKTNLATADGSLAPEVVAAIRDLWHRRIADAPLPW